MPATGSPIRACARSSSLCAPGSPVRRPHRVLRRLQVRKLIAIDAGELFLNDAARLAGDALIEPIRVAAPVHGDDFAFSERPGTVSDRSSEGGRALAGIGFLGGDGGQADVAIF